MQICKKLAVSATLDDTPKQCSERLTDGEELKNLFDEGLDDREAVSGEFLVFRGVGIIEGPLFERDISADEVQEPAKRFILFLNYSK